MKTTSIPPPASIIVSPSRSVAVPPRPPVTSIISEKGGCPSGNTRSFFRAVRAFLSGSVDDLAFQDVSLHRQVSIIYTPNGPLIYRWEPNTGGPREAAGRGALYHFFELTIRSGEIVPPNGGKKKAAIQS